MTYREKDPASRRQFLKMTVAMSATAALASFAGFAHAADLMHVTDSDPTAKALGYVEDASATKNSLYKAGSTCANCQFYTGAAGGYGPCQLFPGKAVNAKGWCSSYTPKKA
ncbi:High potential iron-sulfur protein [Rhodanobacter sp. B04]|uniref:high-potential iron-sulfur protein n=1 Tax=Rhodanobacter sp. B04 TaxID=1945860 RepID=UPI000984BE9A|nr:high-potential iron-sulfur protein [Rhodanobacter sp. B04]OOG63481.1 High potential iron-sulfur protein [Rhodanobacter sp. B04]